MLVLTRRVGESIIIQDTIEVKVVKVNGKRIRLGVIAPKGIAVIRAELHSKLGKDFQHNLDDLPKGPLEGYKKEGKE